MNRNEFVMDNLGLVRFVVRKAELVILGTMFLLNHPKGLP